MQNKLLILFILLSGFSQVTLAEEINVTDADYVGNLTLDTNTNISHLAGELGVMVVKYADVISYTPMEDATSVNHLVGEPGVMIVKYADVISYTPMEDAASVNHLVGESSVMVVKYADVISYTPMEDAASVNHLVGEPGVMVVKYADVISYTPMEDATSVNHLVGEPGVMVVKYADVISYNPLDNPTSVGRRELDITIDYPGNGYLMTDSTVTVNGTAFSPNEITSVTVNGFLATGTASWNATIPLATGINTITVEVTTNTTYSDTKSIQVFHYTEGNHVDTDGDGVIDSWDQENNTQTGFWVNPVGIGRMLGDLNGNGMLDSGDVTILMQMIVGLMT